MTCFEFQITVQLNLVWKHKVTKINFINIIIIKKVKLVLSDNTTGQQPSYNKLIFHFLMQKYYSLNRPLQLFNIPSSFCSLASS